MGILLFCKKVNDDDDDILCSAAGDYRPVEINNHVHDHAKKCYIDLKQSTVETKTINWGDQGTGWFRRSQKWCSLSVPGDTKSSVLLRSNTIYKVKPVLNEISSTQIQSWKCYNGISDGVKLCYAGARD